MHWYKEEYKEREVTKIAWVEKQHSRKWLVLDCTGRIIKRFYTLRQASQYLASQGLYKRAVEKSPVRKYLFTN